MKIDFRKDYKFFFVLIVSIAVILLIAFYNMKLSNIGYVASYDPTANEESYNKTFEVTEVGNEIGEKFIAKYNNLNKIFVKFEQLKIQDRVIISAGEGTIGLKDENGNIICEKPINVQELRLNVDYELTFNRIEDSANKTYYVYFKCDQLVEQGEFYKIYYSEQNLLDTGELFINGEKTEGDMYFQEMYANPGKVLKITIYMLIVIILLSMIAIAIYYHKNITPEKLFWMIIPIICIMFLILMPVFKNHDEGFHWFRILDIAQGNLLTEVIENKPVATFTDSTFEITTKEPENINYKYIIDSIKEGLKDEDEVKYVELSTTSIYNPIQYLPQTLGVVFMKILTGNPMLMAYAARLLNMIMAIGILYLALKKMPFGKIGLIVSMCFPIAIEGFTSMSPDAMTISVAYLFIAYIFNIVFDKDENRKVNKKDTIILLILSVILALCKIVYLPIVGLMILLTKNNFKTKRIHLITVLGIMIIAICANLLWLNTANMYLGMYKDGNSNSQIATIFQAPILYIERVMFTLNYSIDDYIYPLFGSELGWNEFAQMYYILPVIIGVLFVFVNIADDTLKIKMKKYQNIIIALIVLAIVGLIFTSLYIQWNNNENVIIAGIQGRYFIPIIPLLMLLICSNLKLKTEFKTENLAKIAGITLCIAYMYVFIKLILINI